MGHQLSTSHCAGVSFTHPADWSVVNVGPATCVALEPRRGTADFRANVVLTVVDNGPLTFGTWQAGTDRLLPIMLDDYEVIDLQRLAVAGHRGGRRLARHRAPCGREVLVNQWFTSVGGIGVTLSGTADALSFALFNPTFERAAATLRISATQTGRVPPA